LQHVHLALSYNSNQDAVESLVAGLLKEYKRSYPDRTAPRITSHRADLSDVEQTLQLAEAAKSQHGRSVDILIANAGYGKRITDLE
jgi:3-oxoacyl-[acyl-carrier protein] reductase